MIVSDHISLSRKFGSEKLRLALLKLTTRFFYPWADARITRDGWGVKNACKATSTPALDTIHTMISGSTNKVTCGDAGAVAGDRDVSAGGCGERSSAQ